MLRVVSLFFLALFMAGSQAAAPSSEDLGRAVGLVMGSDQPLTKEEHTLFWSYLGSLSKEEKILVVEIIEEQQGDLFDFNLHTWECADISWIKQRIEDCPKADQVWMRLQKNFIDKYGVGLNRTSKIYENSKRILSAAAQRHSYKSVSGEVYDLSNRKVIVETIFSIEGRQRRLATALTPIFQD